MRHDRERALTGANADLPDCLGDGLHPSHAAIVKTLALFDRPAPAQERVTIIANRWQTLSPHVESSEDRGLMVLFRPLAAELPRAGKAGFRDREVVRSVERHLPWIESLSRRALVGARLDS